MWPVESYLATGMECSGVTILKCEILNTFYQGTWHSSYIALSPENCVAWLSLITSGIWSVLVWVGQRVAYSCLSSHCVTYSSSHLTLPGLNFQSWKAQHCSHGPRVMAVNLQPLGEEDISKMMLGWNLDYNTVLWKLGTRTWRLWNQKKTEIRTLEKVGLSSRSLTSSPGPHAVWWFYNKIKLIEHWRYSADFIWICPILSIDFMLIPSPQDTEVIPKLLATLKKVYTGS